MLGPQAEISRYYCMGHSVLYTQNCHYIWQETIPSPQDGAKMLVIINVTNLGFF